MSTLTVASLTGLSGFSTGNSTANVAITNNAIYINNNAVSPLATRNRIINGGMDVWQRATAPAAGTLAAWTYNSVDRWGFYSGPVSATVSRNTSAPSGFLYSTKFQRTAGQTGTEVHLMQQVIESINCFDLSSQSVTLSFWARAGANFSASSNNIIVQIRTGTVADQAINSASWTGLATPLNVNQTISTTWTKYTFTTTLGAGVLEASVVLGFTPTGTAGADDSIFVTGVQLELGSVASPFERRSYGQELALCQRYYTKSYQQNVAPGTAVGQSITNVGNTGIIFTVTAGASALVGGTFYLGNTMRTTPTLTIYDSAGNSGRFSIFYGTYSTNIAPSTLQCVNPAYGFINYLGGVQNMYFDFVASAEL